MNQSHSNVYVLYSGTPKRFYAQYYSFCFPRPVAFAPAFCGKRGTRTPLLRIPIRQFDNAGQIYSLLPLSSQIINEYVNDLKICRVFEIRTRPHRSVLPLHQIPFFVTRVCNFLKLLRTNDLNILPGILLVQIIKTTRLLFCATGRIRTCEPFGAD